MTKVIFIGEMYYSDLSIGGGPIIPGPQPPIPGYPSHPWVPPPPYPDQGLPPIPPGYWGGVAPPWPTHPIAPGGPPPQPTHPIAPGGQPPGYWGGAPLPWPTPPIAPGGPPPQPSHPIVLPPGTIPGLKPEHPIYIPPSSPGVPTHPIVMPPPGTDEKPEVAENWNVVTVWSEGTGWVVAIVPSDTHPGVPTPSA